MAIHNRPFDDERCSKCSVNAKCYACDIYFEGLKRYKNLKDEKKQDVSVDPYDMKYIRCGKGENNELGCYIYDYSQRQIEEDNNEKKS